MKNKGLIDNIKNENEEENKSLKDLNDSYINKLTIQQKTIEDLNNLNESNNKLIEKLVIICYVKNF